MTFSFLKTTFKSLRSKIIYRIADVKIKKKRRSRNKRKKKKMGLGKKKKMEEVDGGRNM